MSPILLLSFVIIVYFIGRYIWRRWRFLQLREELGLRGPPANFFTGNVGDLRSFSRKFGIEKTPFLREYLAKQYGKTFGLYIGGGRLSINTTDMEIAREVFITQFSNFSDRISFPFSSAFPMAESLLQLPKEPSYSPHGWKEVRSLVSPAFTSGKMKKMHPQIRECISTFLACLEQKILLEEFDIYDDWQALTLDVIARCAFAVESDAQINREDVFYVHCRKFFNEHNFQKSWAIAITVLLPPLGPWLRSWSAIGAAERPLIAGLREIVAKRRRSFDAFEGTDLIQLLLQQDIERQENEKKAPLSDSVIISNCYAFLLAGYETTSTSLAYTSFLLAKHPEVQDKLSKEILETFGKEGPIDYERVMSLSYLDAVFHESLRLMPPVVFFTSRTCIKETTIKGLRIPEGITVHVPVHGVHWDEENWPRAKEFLPERFLDVSAKKRIAWMPFGIGPRNCVGMRFAEMEFKTAIAETVRRFELHLPKDSSGELPTMISSILMRPVNGVHLRVVKRA